MTSERLFLDTAYVQGLLNRRDKYHSVAVSLFERVRQAAQVVLTEAILIEAANGLSAYNRSGADTFIRSCYSTSNITVVSVDSELLQRGLDLYSKRTDKDWGLTDCISFVTMQDHGLTIAVTPDNHFVQAGFDALMADK